ncbi:MAG: hypothetical protein Q8P61_01145 [Candidatus Nanopelagicales bacterium]|nr:hypothetical protein [Candidatus Nanopelagicales bacterium]
MTGGFPNSPGEELAVQDFLIGLNPWFCLALSFIPVTVIAVLGSLVSSRARMTNDNLLSSVLRFGGGALVFVAAFTIGGLWQQTNLYLGEATAEYAAGIDLRDTVRQTSSPSTAAAVESALKAYRDQVAQTEIGLHIPLSGSTESRDALTEVHAQVEKAMIEAPTPEDKTSIGHAVRAMDKARADRVDYPERAGVPGVVIMTIMVLSWVVALLVGVYPTGGQKWVKVIQVGTGIIMIGLIQLPVYYLATQSGVVEVLQNSLPL